ncbi:predicted protein [Arabidopsis lyrata subsp. lyrata]|uniref:Predicted protein n=1 Tax=Arabidopsis lyrata subsp. lyrata TaxID=81972 RepID=D7L030_ARALL|nr:predicted protein [Arabidopsis lyrata subsp. lyrata]
MLCLNTRGKIHLRELMTLSHKPYSGHEDIFPHRSLMSRNALSQYRRQDTPERAQDKVPQRSFKSRNALSQYRRQDTPERAQDKVPQRSLRSRNALSQYKRQDTPERAQISLQLF